MNQEGYSLDNITSFSLSGGGIFTIEVPLENGGSVRVTASETFPAEKNGQELVCAHYQIRILSMEQGKGVKTAAVEELREANRIRISNPNRIFMSEVLREIAKLTKVVENSSSLSLFASDKAMAQILSQEADGIVGSIVIKDQSHQLSKQEGLKYYDFLMVGNDDTVEVGLEKETHKIVMIHKDRAFPLLSNQGQEMFLSEEDIKDVKSFLATVIVS